MTGTDLDDPDLQACIAELRRDTRIAQDPTNEHICHKCGQTCQQTQEKLCADCYAKLERKREHMREYKREYRARHRDAYLAARRRWRAANKERINARKRELYRLKKAEQQAGVTP